MRRNDITRAAGGGLFAIAMAICSGLAAAQNTTASPKRVGFLSGLGCSTDANPSPFRRRLAELGWVDGQTVILDCVSTVNLDQVDALAAELVARRPDVLAAQPINYVRALKKATAEIPIVMVTTPNPVESGLVTDLARPEANVTGVASSGREVTVKLIGLLKKLLPRLAKLAVIERNGGDAGVRAQLEKDVSDASTKLEFAWQAFNPATPGDYDAIFARLAAEGFDAAYFEPGPLLDANLTRVAGLAMRHRIPTFGNYPYYAENGLLLAYGGDADPLNERAADYVDKILRGAKPGNLPVTQPVKFNLEVNLKTAKALSLVIPKSFLVVADKVFK
jgi:putative tryptophan/tyrosine transport system substrate-binding protein